MKQSNFSLADVLTVLTALVFGYVCFLGNYFITMGNTRESIILASIITLLLAATALGAKLLKRAKGNFKTNFICEVVVLILFSGLILYFSYKSFFHYFVVAERKQGIQNKLTASITEAQNMFAKYESYAQDRKNDYKRFLDRVVVSQKVDQNTYAKWDFGNNLVNDNFQILQKTQTLHDDLFPVNYSDSAKLGVKDVATIWLLNAKTKIDGWKPIGIVSVANEVEQYSNQWLNDLVTLSKIRERSKKGAEENAQNFDHTLLSDDVKVYFTTRGKPTALAIGSAFVAYILMLLSWFVSKRDSRSIGALQTASYEVVL